MYLRCTPLPSRQPLCIAPRTCSRSHLKLGATSNTDSDSAESHFDAKSSPMIFDQTSPRDEGCILECKMNTFVHVYLVERLFGFVGILCCHFQPKISVADTAIVLVSSHQLP